MKASTTNFFAAAIALLVSAGAAAQELDYNYLELRYVEADLDDSGVDGNGILVGGSYELTEEFLVVGSYSNLGFDFDIDLSTLQIGLGYVVPTETRFDLVGYARLLRATVDVGSQDDSDNGYSVSAGTRGLLTDQVELRAFLNHVNIESSDTFIELAGDYYINDQFSVGASFELGGDVDTFTIGGRYFFGN